MKRNTPNKREITLMTLLANEATADSRKLLKKYNVADAKDCSDLEVKLAKLYFNTPDKLAIEKDFAEIHPHKNWILKRTKVEEVEKPIEAEVPIAVAVAVEPQKTSSAERDCNNPYCPVHGKCIPFSNFGDDVPTNPQWRTIEQQAQIDKENQAFFKEHPYTMALPIIGMVAVAGFIFYALTSNKTKF